MLLFGTRFMLCVLLPTFYFSQSVCKFLKFEAEDAEYTGSKKPRSAASGQATIHLVSPQSVKIRFTTQSSCSVAVQEVSYTNDGGSDVIEVHVDGNLVGSFNTNKESKSGLNWNVVRKKRMIGQKTKLRSGSHELILKAAKTDVHGVELDKTILNLNCISSAQPNPLCTNINSLTGGTQCSNSPIATRNSTSTLCAEEDNVNIPIFYSGIQSFKITAQLPEYFPSLTTMDNRKDDFTNCTIKFQNIWQIGENDDSHSEFAHSCSSFVYYIGESSSSFCHKITNNYNNTKYTIFFTTKGITSGRVEASIGSVLTLNFAEVTGNLTLEVRCFGRDKKWLSLGLRSFRSGDLVKMWQVPDLTWSEGENTIELIVSNRSSLNASGKFDYLKLDKRNERGENRAISVFNDGKTIIEAIKVDFWWLYPKSMTIMTLHNNKEWHNITYFRIYRKIPGTENNYSQLFVLYQDGNSRILPFPPNYFDSIPFGSSVIIGPTRNPLRPYASISRVNVRVDSLAMEIHYEYGGKATAKLQYSATSTTVSVYDITYTSNSLIPFATFRSMYVADGNADVDHIKTQQNSWHIHSEWRSISSSSFKFFRSCVSKHNTLSPDILIVVNCKTPNSSNKVNMSHWTLVLLFFFFKLYTA